MSAFQPHFSLTNAEHVQKGIWIKALGAKTDPALNFRMKHRGGLNSKEKCTSKVTMALQEFIENTWFTR